MTIRQCRVLFFNPFSQPSELQVNANLVSSKSRILELLEEELLKSKQRLNEVRQRRAEMTPSKRKRMAGEGTPISGVRKDLYKVALLLREANKISQFLKKSLVIYHFMHLHAL